MIIEKQVVYDTEKLKKLTSFERYYESSQVNTNDKLLSILECLTINENDEVSSLGYVITIEEKDFKLFRVFKKNNKYFLPSDDQTGIDVLKLILDDKQEYNSIGLDFI